MKSVNTGRVPSPEARLMRALPELMVLVKGMVNATKSVLSTLVLLIIFLSPRGAPGCAA